METSKYNLIHFDILSSTNDYLKENYKTLKEYTVVSCNYQTNGKGRRGHLWISNNQENLLMSILLKPNIETSIINLLPLMTGVAVFNVLQSYVEEKKIEISIKWPNDVMVNNYKVSGILLESIITEKIDALVIGIGLNVFQLYFPEDLNKASSLKKEFKIDFDIEKLKKQIIIEFDYLYQLFLLKDFSFLEINRNNNFLLNKKINYNDNEYEVIDINEMGYLVVKRENEILEISMGEITLSYLC